MTGNDLLTHAGTTQPVNEWALDYGIYPAVILDRLARGWPAERAITTPMLTVPRQRLDAEHMPRLPVLRRKGGNSGPTAQIYEHGGRSLTVKQWSAVTGIKPSTIHRRLRHGWPMTLVLNPKPHERPGVPANFPEPVGTGGGPTTQDFTEIEFSQ